MSTLVVMDVKDECDGCSEYRYLLYVGDGGYLCFPCFWKDNPVDAALVENWVDPPLAAPSPPWEFVN